MPEKDHPLWALLRTAIVGGVAVFALWSNYNQMDARDIVTVVEVMGIVGGLEWWTHRKQQ